jgi:hypothetical protein
MRNGCIGFYRPVGFVPGGNIFWTKCTTHNENQSKARLLSQASRYCEVADLPHHCLSAGLLVLMQDWAFLHRCLVLDRPNTSESIRPIDILCENLPKMTLIVNSFPRFIKSILVLLVKPVFNACSLNFPQIESARSSSSSCCAASLVWGKGLVHYCTVPTNEVNLCI